jgi:hypothetical protein
VTLFESYFRLHPFYYESIDLDKDVDYKKVYEELKKNIKILLPKFTIEKWMKHIQSLKCIPP